MHNNLVNLSYYPHPEPLVGPVHQPCQAPWLCSCSPLGRAALLLLHQVQHHPPPFLTSLAYKGPLCPWWTSGFHTDIDPRTHLHINSQLWLPAVPLRLTCLSHSSLGISFWYPALCLTETGGFVGIMPKNNLVQMKAGVF